MVSEEYYKGMSLDSPLEPLEKPVHRVPKKFRSKAAFLGYGLILGVLLICGIRFATYAPKHTHYHANFAVYLNGQRETFKDPSYYEDVAACTAYDNITPAERAHMHGNVNNVVHVHDDAVTWGQFFENLGWYIGDDFIKTDKQMYLADGANKLHIMINGQDYTNLTAITNRVIGDQDKLLVSFGDISTTALKQEYSGIKNEAKKADETQDPASCSGHQSPGFTERLKHLL
jgi:hypothetical protein